MASERGLEAEARALLRRAGGDPAWVERVAIDTTRVGSVVASLAARDARPGADRVWRAAVGALVVAEAAVVAIACQRAGALAELDAAQAAGGAFVHPLEHLGGARGSVETVVTRRGRVAIQAPTEQHRLLAAACAGVPNAVDWRAAVRSWAATRTGVGVERELQEWGVPALALGRGHLRHWAAEPASAVMVPRRADASRPLAGIRVVELGGLWAAPFATRLLGWLGATVVKVEAPMRPDGARFGPADHFAALNAGKTVLRLDLRSIADRNHFVTLLGPGVVVVENQTARVLPNLGIPPNDLVASGAAVVRLPASRRRPNLRALGSLVELASGLAIGVSPAPIPFTDALTGAYAAVHAALAVLGTPHVRVVGQIEDVAHAVPVTLAGVGTSEAADVRVRTERVLVDGAPLDVPARPWVIHG